MVDPQRRRVVTRLTLGSALAVAGMRASADVATPGAASAPRPSPGQRFDIALDVPFTGYLLTGATATQLATARLVATQDEAGYRIVLDVESFLADITYESTGTVDAGGLVPREFSEKRKVAFRSPRERRVRYVYADAEPPRPSDSRSSSSGADQAEPRLREGELLVPAGTQDRLSLMLHMMALGRADAGVLRSGNDLSIPFASTSRVSESRWRISGPEPVASTDEAAALPDAPRGYRIVRVADSNNTIDVSFWLAASAAHLPLVLQFSESGRSLRFVHHG